MVGLVCWVWGEVGEEVLAWGVMGLGCGVVGVLMVDVMLLDGYLLRACRLIA